MAVGRSPRDEEPSLAGGAEIRYIETSALVAAIVEHDVSADQAIRGEGQRVASALTFAEARRAISVLGTMGRINAAAQRSALGRLRRLEAHVDVMPIGAEVLERIGKPFPVERVRSLDAIHLSTTELLDESPQLITVVTRDRRIIQNARAMGFVVE